jgi:hypothetical protein
VRTTIQIPDELFRRAKATAAQRGETLGEFISEAIETHLGATSPPAPPRSGWRSVFGLAPCTAVESIDTLFDAELEQVDPSQWR